jgi:hypothetical protein
MNRISLIILATLLLTISNLTEAAKLKQRAYSKQSETMGVILMHVNWGRQWSCANYQNAQLVSLQFEKTSLARQGKNKNTEIQLKTPSRLSVNPVDLPYGFLVEPGTYAFTSWSIKAARSMKDVGYLKASHEELVDDTKYLGGTVNVEAGEVIYIGHFDLDCAYSPVPWRYYAEGKESFENQKAEYRKEFKFLRNEEIKYRLLETTNYGRAYILED